MSIFGHPQNPPATGDNSPHQAQPQTAGTAVRRSQRLKSGLKLKALPGQGHHKFVIGLAADIYQHEDVIALKVQDKSIPLEISKAQQVMLETSNLPISETVVFYPKISHGEIVAAHLLEWGDIKPFIKCQGLVVPKLKMLVVQTDFHRWGKRSRDYIHTFKAFPKNCPSGFCEIRFKTHGIDLDVRSIRPLPLHNIRSDSYG